MSDIPPLTPEQAIREMRFLRERDKRIAELESELAALRHDIDAYRGALGYSVPGDHDGRLSDGTTPKCGLCEAKSATYDEFVAAGESETVKRLREGLKRLAYYFGRDQTGEGRYGQRCCGCEEMVPAHKPDCWLAELLK